MSRPTRLAGHALPREGRMYDERERRFVSRAPAVCECGWTSPLLESDNARRRAHRLHKEDVLAARALDEAGA